MICGEQFQEERKEAQVSDTGRANRLSEYQGRVENTLAGSRDLLSVYFGLRNLYKCSSLSLQVNEMPIIRTQLGNEMAELIKERIALLHLGIGPRNVLPTRQTLYKMSD